MFIPDVSRLIELLDRVLAERVAAEVAPQAILELRAIQEAFRTTTVTPLDTALDVLALTYKLACLGNSGDIAAPLHEGLYNAMVRGSLDHLTVLYVRRPKLSDEIGILLRELLPDPVILQAMLHRQPTTVSLVHEAKVQFGYLKRRTEPLAKLIALIRKHQTVLAIARSDAFENFMRLLDKLKKLGELIPTAREG